MGVKITNNAISTLANSISDTDTSVAVQAGDASEFPTLTGADWTRATILDAAGNIEIVKVTARAGATLTVVRGQEGTTAIAWDAGDRIECRLTAGALDDFTEPGARVHDATAQTTLADADEFGFWRAASTAWRKITWANFYEAIRTKLGPLVSASSAKSTPVDADQLLLSDSAASNGSAKLSWLNLKAGIWTALGALINGGTAKTTLVDADLFPLADSEASNASKKVTLANLRTAIGTGMNTAERRNALLRFASIAKALLGYQRDLNAFAAGFKGASDAADGIYVAGSSAYQRDSSAGCVGPEPAGVDSYVKLLLHGDGVDASTTITDSSASARTMTANGDAQIDTAQKKFGSAAILFDGTGDYVTTPTHADLDFGTGDFTVDFWVRVNAFAPATSCPINIGSYNGGGLAVYLGASSISLYLANTNHVSGAVTINTGTWYHIEISRSGTSLRVFLDGVQVSGSPFTNSGSHTSSVGVRFGIDLVDPNARFNGWLDEVRVSKGVARHTANFTPPAAAYSATVADSTVQFLQQTVDSTGFLFGVAEVHPVEAMTIGTTYVVEVYTGGAWVACTVANAGTGEGGRTVVAFSKSGMTPATTVDVRIRTVGKDHRTYRFGYDARNAA